MVWAARQFSIAASSSRAWWAAWPARICSSKLDNSKDIVCKLYHQTGCLSVDGRYKKNPMKEFLLVGEEGIEPSRTCVHRILSPARLPVPPPAQKLPGAIFVDSSEASVKKR